MFKNAVIAFLLSALWFTQVEFSLIMFICTAAVLFFVVWGIEEAVDRLKSRKALHRKVNNQIKGIKIIPDAPTKAS